MLLMRHSRRLMYHGTMGAGESPWGRVWGGARRAELTTAFNFCVADAKVMFGTLTLIKRNGSEGSTMTMDSRETTIGR